MPHKYSAAALLLLGGLVHANAQAQDLNRVQRKLVAEDGTPAFVHFKLGSQAYSLSEARKALTDQLQLTKDDQVLQTKAETDQLGFVHERFDQYYRGIKVEHASYSVHARQGTIESISGHFAPIKELNVTPSLTATAALQRALDYVGARKYMWQDATEEANLRQDKNDLAATYKPSGELVIVTPPSEAGTVVKPVLAWKFNVYAQQPVSRAYIYVDAQTGQVVMKDDIIKHAGATATFATAYSGTRTFADETTTGGYRLREYTRGLGIETYNCKKSNSYTSATDFVDADNNWTATEYNNTNYDNVAGDAHFGAQATYDYWKAVHSRNSFDNAGAKIKSYVHFDDQPGGAGYENAFWDGTRMTYGVRKHRQPNVLVRVGRHERRLLRHLGCLRGSARREHLWPHG
jgi:bacillolysin